LKHRTSRRFWTCYDSLPAEIRSLADKNFDLLEQNPAHPSLHFKKVGNYGSARVGIDYRAVAVRSGEDFVWFWIGGHAEYDRLIA
jgi:hypothetical protein